MDLRAEGVGSESRRREREVRSWERCASLVGVHGRGGRRGGYLFEDLVELLFGSLFVFAWFGGDVGLGGVLGVYVE